jgi:hypothetical protein
VRFFAFKNGEATKPLEDLLSRPNILQDQSLAQTLSHETRVAEKLGKRGFKEEYDSMFDKFFAFIHGKPSAYLEKHPAFKQRYYTWAVDEMITSLSPAELDKMIQRIEDAAKIAKVSPSDWVGDKTEFAEVVNRLFKTSKPAVGDRWERILELQKNPKKLKGTLTLEEVDEFAKGQALDDLAKMTYDATERNNLTDVSRFILPFGQAQLEFFRRLGRIYTVETGILPLPNLNAMRKTQLLIEGGREADPDGDGRGIFYTDPGTGEWVVDYPFTGPFTHLLTSMVSGGPGVRSTLQAPIKGALMGLDVRPGLGPVAQIAVSAFAPDIPQLDAFKAAVLPYGEVDLAGNKGLGGSVVDAFTPAWFKKIQSAFIDSPESMTTYGNTYFEVYQALSTTGEYDLKTPAGMDRLYQDAKNQAKALTILRGIGQYLGPSRPTNKFQVETLQGDVMVNVLSQELRTMQLEDYDSAIPRFLDIYGEDVFTYYQAKPKPFMAVCWQAKSLATLKEPMVDCSANTRMLLATLLLVGQTLTGRFTPAKLKQVCVTVLPLKNRSKQHRNMWRIQSIVRFRPLLARTLTPNRKHICASIENIWVNSTLASLLPRLTLTASRTTSPN